MNGLTQFLGILISLLASFTDALGLNLQRRDHLREAKVLKPRHECMRPLWHLGLYLYVASQVLGSSLVLYLLSPQQAAPLGAFSLVFNFLFARYLVGTHITRRDILGTFVVLFSILIIILTDTLDTKYQENDAQKDISLETLKVNFKTFHFLIYFVLLNSFVCFLFFGTLYSKWLLENPERFRHFSMLGEFELGNFSKITGLSIAAVGGIIASETLLLAGSGVIIIQNLLVGNPAFEDSASFFIVFLLILTAFLQVYCLNSALKLADSIVVVPVFSCTYNVFTLSNSLFYFNLFHIRSWWFYIVSSMGVLCLSFGIFILAHQDKPLPSSVPSIRNYFYSKEKHPIISNSVDSFSLPPGNTHPEVLC